MNNSDNVYKEPTEEEFEEWGRLLREAMEEAQNMEYVQPDFMLLEGEEIPEDVPLTEDVLMKISGKYGKQRYLHLKEINPSKCYTLCALGVMKHELALAQEKASEMYDELYWSKRNYLTANNPENLNDITISAIADSYANEVIYEVIIKQEDLFYVDD